MLELIYKDGILGHAVAHIHVIEFQKRGLPHAHLVIFLAPNCRPRTAEEIDAAVCAELPPESNPELRRIITDYNLHGPCGTGFVRACNGSDGTKPCKYFFPKSWNEESFMREDGFPEYRRRNNGDTFTRRIGNDNFVFDNRWVVPYNSFLSQYFDAHINVELVGALGSVKYLYEYIYKGPDISVARVNDSNAPQQPVDEIKQFVTGRYIGSYDAAWFIYGLRRQGMVPSVTRLEAHGPSQHMVYFHADHPPSASQHPTVRCQIEAWFKLNLNDLSARSVLYVDLPSKFTWQKKEGVWKRRAKKQKSSSVGRLWRIHPSAGDAFFVRCLLYEVPGATSWTDLRTVDGTIHTTFRDAAAARGLLADDREWDMCLTEAASIDKAHRLRQLFAVILLHCEPQRPDELWEKHKDSLSDDILFQLKRETRNRQQGFTQQIYDTALLRINDILVGEGKSLDDFPGLHVPAQSSPLDTLSPDERLELAYDPVALANHVAQSVPHLNAGQRHVYDTICTALDGPVTNRAFFIEGKGGTGKTHLYNLIAARQRSLGRIVLMTATTGLAALLLDGGRTAHYRFKLPLKPSKDSSLAHLTDATRILIRNADLCIIDEATRLHRHSARVLDDLFRELGDPSFFFGGKTIIFGGDFQQTLPIVRGGGVAASYDASLLRWNNWPHMRRFTLTENIRVSRLRGQGTDTNILEAFDTFLTRVGDGSEPIHSDVGPHRIRLPNNIVATSTTLPQLITEIYGPPHAMAVTAGHHAILTTLNADVATINEVALAAFPGASRDYLSADSAGERSDAVHFPPEMLNALTPPGLPTHKLSLKVGAPAMLLRNLCGAGGQANGTRIIIKQMLSKVLDVEIAEGRHRNKRFFLPRITLSAEDDERAGGALKLRCRQFPCRLCFGMTIDKAQGQTLERAGVYLPSSVFAPGQLYVGLSRVGSPEHLHVLVEGGTTAIKLGVFTANITLRSALQAATQR